MQSSSIKVNDELGQLIQGSWGALHGRSPCQFVFYKVPYGTTPVLKGYKSTSNKIVREDQPMNHTHQFDLQKLNIYEKHGTIYICFFVHNWTIQAMVNKRLLLMRGCITHGTTGEVRPFFAQKILCFYELCISKLFVQKQCGDELEQLLQGSWAAIWGRAAAELVFFKVGYGTAHQLQGYQLTSHTRINGDNEKSDVKKIHLQNIKVFQRFGMAYVSFKVGQAQVEAMINKKQLSMDGAITYGVGQDEKVRTLKAYKTA